MAINKQTNKADKKEKTAKFEVKHASIFKYFAKQAWCVYGAVISFVVAITCYISLAYLPSDGFLHDGDEAGQGYVFAIMIASLAVGIALVLIYLVYAIFQVCYHHFVKN